MQAQLSKENFENPPMQARPSTYWMWMNGHISKEGITADLEYMKRNSYGAAMMFNAGVGIARGAVDYASPQWDEMTIHAVKEAERLGMAVFTPAKGRYFRLTTNRSTNLSEVNLHASDRLANWTAKTNYVKDPVALGSSAQQVNAVQCIDPSKVIDITAFMDADGNVKWKAPQRARGTHRESAVRWTILRLGATTTGEVVAASPDSGRGLDCDKFSKEALDQHFDLFLDPLLNKLKPWCGKTLTTLMMDSWEAGKQNWTSSLPAFFRQRKGYDVTPWLLAMTGRVVKSVDATERFLYDMRRTQTDMFNENFLAHFKERAARYGLKFAGEPYGDGNFESLEYAEQLDYPMSEFWIHYIYGGVTTSKMAASTAHLWNRPVVGAECFTGTPFNSKLTEHPYAMKAEGDYMMTTGVNRFVYHVFAHQPYVGGTPGTFMTMGPFGTHLNRNSVWAEQAVGLNTYNSRCASMLQQGLYAADILYIKEEGISSGIADYDFTEPATPYGYRWDIGSKNVLNRLTVKEGKLTLPHGMSYRILVITPMKQCSPELLQEVKRLIQQGATVVLSGEKPEGYMGLDENKDKEVQRLADELWREESSDKGKRWHIYYTQNLQKVLNAERIRPDFSFVSVHKDAQIHFIHRSVEGDEVYFISNHRRRPETLTATFRISGMKPTLWNAETGETELPVPYKEENGMTKVTLSLTESGSTFIVFRPSENGEKGIAKLAKETANFKEVTLVSSLSSPIYHTFTISMWAKPETFAASGRGFLLFPDKGEERYGKGHATVGIAMGQNTVRVYERASANQIVLESKVPVEGWTHVALVYQEGVPTLYLNGKVAAVGKQSAYICSPAYDVPMAEEQYVGSFEGDQTKVVYADEAWTAEEVKTDMAIGLPQPMLSAETALLQNLDGAWKVRFPTWSKAPAEITLPALESLHKQVDFNVRHFSGKSTYLKTFTLTKKEWKNLTKKEASKQIVLDLGRVENLAEVSINGSSSVLVWKAPYQLDITHLIKLGENELKIEVTNLYPNRLIGDEYLPEKHKYDEYGRICQFPSWYLNQEEDTDRQRVLFCPWKHYAKEDPLLEAGLLGPVRIIYTKEGWR